MSDEALVFELRGVILNRNHLYVTYLKYFGFGLWGVILYRSHCWGFILPIIFDMQQNSIYLSLGALFYTGAIHMGQSSSIRAFGFHFMQNHEYVTKLKYLSFGVLFAQKSLMCDEAQVFELQGVFFDENLWYARKLMCLSFGAVVYTEIIDMRRSSSI